jgi:hypothetical protein
MMKQAIAAADKKKVDNLSEDGLAALSLFQRRNDFFGLSSNSFIGTKHEEKRF